MNHLGWACEGGVRRYLFKLNNSRALRGSLCGWFRDTSASSCGPHPFVGDQAARPGDEAYRRDNRHPRGAPGWPQSGVQSCLGVLEGPAGSLFAWWLQLFSITVIKTIASLGAQKPLELISSQLCVSEVWVSWAGFSNPGLTKPRSGCWLASTVLWRWWGRLCSQPHPVPSFAAAPLSSCCLLGVVGDLRQPGETPYFPHGIFGCFCLSSVSTWESSPLFKAHTIRARPTQLIQMLCMF